MTYKQELKALGSECVKWIKVANGRIECRTSRICWAACSTTANVFDLVTAPQGIPRKRNLWVNWLFKTCPWNTI